MKKAVFLDKDGTLIRDVPFNADPSLVELLPGVPDGLRSLQKAGFKLIVVSNQPGIALGYFTEVDLLSAIRRLHQLLANEGIFSVAFYYCPHAANGTVEPYAHPCHCRKPQPGLLLRAAKHLEISLPDSWMIGDILDDIEAGRRAGCRTALLNNGNETQWVINDWRKPDLMFPHFDGAASAILQATNDYVYPPNL